MKTLYTAHATAVEGRNGHAQTDDGNLSVELGTPGGQSKKTGKITNPEQLFACGYAACFGSAIEAVAKKENAPIRNAEVHSEVSLNQDDKGGYFISATLNVVLTGVDEAQARGLVEKAHQICPYSKATRGNIEVTLKVNSQEIKKAA
jgi:osmotically inducible protein OsmC